MDVYKYTETHHSDSYPETEKPRLASTVSLASALCVSRSFLRPAIKLARRISLS